MGFDLSRYRLVMFDLDGTLVDSALDLHAALNRTLLAMGRESVSEEQTRVWVGNGARVLVNRALWLSLDATEDHSGLDEGLAHFLDFYSEENGKRSTAYPGACALLSQLRAADIKVAIVTNKPFTPAQVLVKQLGLECDVLLGGDSLPAKKPDPQPLLHCINLLEVEKYRCAMVGDSVNDFEAAFAAGIDAIGVSYGYNHGKPIDSRNLVAFVDSLTELG